MEILKDFLVGLSATIVFLILLALIIAMVSWAPYFTIGALCIATFIPFCLIMGMAIREKVVIKKAVIKFRGYISYKEKFGNKNKSREGES